MPSSARPCPSRSNRPVDPDVDLRAARQRRDRRGRGAQVVAVIAAGAMLGAAARHGVALSWPTAADALPWSTLIVNVTGCLLIGVLMVLIVEARTAHRLVRPFLGVGVLGGYTTFSTYAVDTTVLFAAGRPAVAVAYLVGTALAALAAVQLGVVLTRAVAAVHPEAGATRRATPGGGTR